MKTRIKIKIALLVLVAGMSFSCKKADTVPADATYDSTAITVDSTAIDTTNVPQDTTTVITDTTAVPKQ